MFPDLQTPERWTTPEVLAYQRQNRPDELFVRIIDGEAVTFTEAEDDASRVASYFAELGVHPGDRVAVLLHNSLDLVRVWLGLHRLGAVLVVLNTELTGAFLAHQVESCGARVAVTSGELVPALVAIASRLTTTAALVLCDDTSSRHLPPFPEKWMKRRFDAWRTCSRYDGPMPLARDVATIIFTSGTSGRSKGVLMPHAHCFLFGLGAVEHLELAGQDTYYVVLPLFHANGLFMQVYACLIAGASAVVRRRFSATAWLDDVRRCGATHTNMLGALSAFVIAQKPRPADREHRLRCIVAGPNLPEHAAIWKERFGVSAVVSVYGMTETGIVAWGNPQDCGVGTAGRPYERHFEVEIRDPETDQSLGPVAVGEIMVRPKVMFGFMAGYHGMPSTTVEIWRNLWFHTGDAGLIRPDGSLVFIDRIKDCIRRRGENISSHEVEAAIMRLQGVVEAAAYPVRSSIAGGEDEVMVAVVLDEDAKITMEEIAAHADRELPRFARPRYLEIVSALPKTPTSKVKKTELKARGVTAATWDRDKSRNES